MKNIKVGDLVVAPFTASDGTCPECRAGMTTACRNGLTWGMKGYDGGQGEKVRVPMADGTLFVIPGDRVTERMMPAQLPLSDMLCTGHHGAACAEVRKGPTVAVIGDGAVGLCAVAASTRLGAARIFFISTHEDRARPWAKVSAQLTLSRHGARKRSARSKLKLRIWAWIARSNAWARHNPGTWLLERYGRRQHWRGRMAAWSPGHPSC